jgi:hypothetical protein
MKQHLKTRLTNNRYKTKQNEEKTKQNGTTSLDQIVRIKKRIR